MTQQDRKVKAFVKLGEFLAQFCEFINTSPPSEAIHSKWHKRFDDGLRLAHLHNGWFTTENILYAFSQWADLLNEKNLINWLSGYDLDKNIKKTVALIMAGNIPLVGFHDLLVVLITGNKALVKMSSNDRILMPLLANYLEKTEPLLKGSVEFTEGKLTNFDAVIATGSNNTARYFEYYFGQRPNIIRKNRNSVAVLTGNENENELKALGEDVFRYYGLGCRSVSKVFVPKDYNFDAFFNAIFPFSEIVQQAKYANNYDYNKAVYLMSEFKILDNGFLILKEDNSYASPIASLFYERYESEESLKERLRNDKEHIQCIVASGFVPEEVNFGKTQCPSLSDYADGLDTVEFLLGTS
ncbi:acyl-CoA reductase [Maribacter sp. 2304DJ31-5]|uniref:acyl-CoA reductase n=1 Tax=Maribacter sp. 2304DJ31-5 TaxID=3386273 RepID=UPI0039BD137E